MESKKFIELCNLWNYSSWQKEKLTDYWAKAGLSVENILDNHKQETSVVHC